MSRPSNVNGVADHLDSTLSTPDPSSLASSSFVSSRSDSPLTLSSSLSLPNEKLLKQQSDDYVINVDSSPTSPRSPRASSQREAAVSELHSGQNTKPKDKNSLRRRSTKLNSEHALSSHTQPENHSPLSDSNKKKPDTVHSVWKIFRELELSKHVLVVAVPMIIALYTINDPEKPSYQVCILDAILAFGVAASWSGILFRETYHRASMFLEPAGVALILLAFYGLVGCLLPMYLIWVPILCCLLTFAPYIKAAIDHCGDTDSDDGGTTGLSNNPHSTSPAA